MSLDCAQVRRAAQPGADGYAHEPGANTDWSVRVLAPIVGDAKEEDAVPTARPSAGVAPLAATPT